MMVERDQARLTVKNSFDGTPKLCENATSVLPDRVEFYHARWPGSETAIAQITLKPPTENSLGLRLGSFVLVRDAIEDELEEAFAGGKTAKAALDQAVVRGNEMLRQFERARR